MALLRPQGIGEAQLDAFLVVGLVELPLQLTKGGMEPRLVCPEVQDMGHLRFGVAAGAGIGHRQRGGNAVGREE